MLQHLNWIDYVILTIFLFSVLAGLSRGLLKEVISLCTMIAAFTISVLFANPLAEAFTSSPTVQNVVNDSTNAIGASTAAPVSYAALGLSFGFLFAATVLIGAIIGSILNLIFQSSVLGFGNRLLGGIFGLCRGFIINLVLIFLVQLTSFSSDNFWTQSLLVIRFQPAVVWLAAHISPSLADLKTKMTDTLSKMAPVEEKK